ncbi:hypothetical protein AB0M20_40890 [Actinoplanes sp. NPDC051633]|uniref:hypothetical protein n=1 Tax=Actinoplanes sp. NPDC051633 TaxID=3155670 RepID=UPI003435A2BE
MAHRRVLLVGAVLVAAAIGAPMARTVMAPGQVPAVVPEVAPPVVVAPASPPENVEGGPPPFVGVEPPEPTVTSKPRSRIPKKDPPPRTRDTSGPGGVVAPTTVPPERDAPAPSPPAAPELAPTRLPDHEDRPAPPMPDDKMESPEPSD